MQFVDFLTAQLFVMSFVGVIGLYALYKIYKYHSKLPLLKATLPSVGMVLFVLGIYGILSGLYGQFVWPLPGNYNILFYDMYPLFGFSLAAIGYALYKGMKTEPAGLFSALIGAMSIFYGIVGYMLGMTTYPIMLLIIYVAFGMVGITMLPASRYLDMLLSGKKLSGMRYAKAIFVALCIFMAIAALASAITGAPAAIEHLMA